MSRMVKQVPCETHDKGLGYLLVKKWGWSPLKAAFWGWLLGFVAAFIVAISSNRFWPDAHYRSLLEDAFWWVIQFTVPPLIWGYFVWSLCAADNVLVRLRQNGVLKSSVIVEDIWREVFDERLNNVGAMAFSFFYTLLGFYTALKGPAGWWNASVFSLLFLSFPAALQAYVAAYAVIRLWLNVRIFNKALSLMEYMPLHPDGAGGGSPLGEYALKILYVFAGGASIAVFVEYWLYDHQEISTAYSFHLVIFLYIVLAPLLFFVPLWKAHKVMKQRRNDMLSRISERFQKVLLEIESQSSKECLLKEIEVIKGLKELQDIIYQFPVWPFDINILRKAIATYLSPFFTLVVSLLTESVSKTFVK